MGIQKSIQKRDKSSHESPSPGPVPAGSQAQLPWWCCSNLGCFMGAQTDTVILNSFWHVIWKYIWHKS